MNNKDKQPCDTVKSNIKKIEALFPCAVVETGNLGAKVKTVDFSILKKLLSYETLKEDAKKDNETYEFTWIGKKASIKEAQKTTDKTLYLCEKESKKSHTTENLYIEGDNLDVLKILKNNFESKVDVIYIDPPYNTGQNFIYKDRFAMDKKEYEDFLKLANNGEEKELKNTCKNSGYYERLHSFWCSFMYPRLLLARDLLTKDGVIFISIDDNEQDNLKKICSEIFGEENFIALFKWNRIRKAPSLSTTVRTKFEYVLAYYKKEKVNLYGRASYNKQGPLWHLPNKRKELLFPPLSIRVKKSFAKGNYGGTYQVELLDDIVCKEGLNKEPVRICACSAWGQRKINQYVKQGHTFEIKVSPLTVYTDLHSTDNFIAPSDLISFEECGVKCNTDSKEDMKKLGIPFDYAKPVSLIEYLLNMALYNKKNAICLDFFSGSGTTAEAVMRLNAKDQGKRKFIMVQIPELCPKVSQAYKEGFIDICHIGKERIRRAGDKIIADLNNQKAKAKNSNVKLDIGFKVYKLDYNNTKTTDLCEETIEVKNESN